MVQATFNNADREALVGLLALVRFPQFKFGESSLPRMPNRDVLGWAAYESRHVVLPTVENLASERDDDSRIGVLVRADSNQENASSLQTERVRVPNVLLHLQPELTQVLPTDLHLQREPDQVLLP
jgi:hypothetical protein